MQSSSCSRKDSNVHEAFKAEIEVETKTFKPETEARPRRWSTCSRRDRDRDIHVRDRGETEAIGVRGEAEARRRDHGWMANKLYYDLSLGLVFSADSRPVARIWPYFYFNSTSKYE